jgi:hypothetical protein
MIEPEVIRAIEAEARRHVSERRGQVSRLYIDDVPVRKGTRLGYAFQRVTVPEESVLVFIDDEPRVSFAHDCRYLLFHPRSGQLRAIIAARFPPYLGGVPRSYRLLAGRSPLEESPPEAPPPPLVPASPPTLQPIQGTGRRCAILFCGDPDPSHVNTLEFAWRVLRHGYGLAAADILVPYYTGVLTTSEWGVGTTKPPGNWPGDGTQYELLSKVSPNYPGNRYGMKRALDDLALTSEDRLFLLTTGHGEGTWDVGTYLGTFLGTSTTPVAEKYTASDLCDDLSGRSMASLLVLMLQCSGGGFKQKILASDCAPHISFACAADALSQAYKCDGAAWDTFARDWLAAQNWGYPAAPVDVALPFTADNTGSAGIPDERVSALEAFVYATKRTDGFSDSPQYGSTSVVADGLDLR